MSDRHSFGTSLRISYPELESHLRPWNIQKSCQRCAREPLRFFEHMRALCSTANQDSSCCSNQAVQPKHGEKLRRKQEREKHVEMRPDEVRCSPKAHQPGIERDAAFQGLLADSKRLCNSFSTLCGLAGSRIVKFAELARSLEIQGEQLRWHHVFFHTRVQSRWRAMSLLEVPFASLHMLLVLASVASSCVRRKSRLPLANL